MAADTTSPSLNVVSLSPWVVDISAGAGTATLSLLVADDLSGVDYVFAYIRHPDGDLVAMQQLTLVSGTDLSGVYSTSISIPQFSEPGDYEIEIDLKDNAGNFRMVRNADKLFGDNFTVISTGPVDAIAPTISSISMPDWTVDISGGTGSATLNVEVADNLSGVDYVFAYIRHADGDLVAMQHLSRVAGDDLAGTYSATVSIPQFSEPGDYEIEIDLKDNADNFKIVRNADKLFGDNFVVTSSQPIDIVAPAIAAIAVSPWTVDTGVHSATATLTLQTTDDLSGIDYVFAYIRHADGDLVAMQQLTRTSGTELAGTYSTTFAIPRFSEPGDYEIEIDLKDNADNFRMIRNADKLFGDNFVVTSSALPGDNLVPDAADDIIQNAWFGLSINPNTLLANDTDADGDPLTITNVTSGVGGSVSYHASFDDSIYFTPTSGYVGVASFTYQVTDGIATSAPATVYLSVGGWPNVPGPPHPNNHAPVAQDDTITGNPGFVAVDPTTLVRNDSDVDGDQLAIAAVSDAVGGTVTYFNGHIFFNVDEGFVGEASFKYRATDGYATSDPATVKFTISEPVVVTPFEPPIFTPPIVHTPPVVFTPYEPPTRPPIRFAFDIHGTAGADLIDGKSKVYGRTTSSHNDNVFGSGGNDTVKALGGDDSIRGDAGNDMLYGNNGKDTLIGGAGKDALTGGKHADVFVFSAKLGASNVDTITDFKHDSDLIALDDKIFKTLAGSLTEKQFYSAAGAAKAHDKSDRIIYDTKSGKLYYDDDGKGGHAAVQFAVLSSKPALDHGDFVIV